MRAEGGDATLVLIPPVGNDTDCWQYLGLRRARPMQYPGHGLRERKAGWTHASYADEVVEVTDGLLDLVGVSLGGTIVANILVRHPERVRSAVIVCSSAVSRGGLPKVEQDAKRRALLARGERALEGGMKAVVEETLERWFTPYALRTAPPGVSYARDALLRLDPLSWYDTWTCHASSVYLPFDQLAAISAPVTIIGGIHDRAAGLAGLAQLHQVIPRSRYEVIAGPHMLHLEQPQSLLGALERHFVWAPVGNRVEQPIGSFVWSDVDPFRRASA